MISLSAPTVVRRDEDGVEIFDLEEWIGDRFEPDGRPSVVVKSEGRDVAAIIKDRRRSALNSGKLFLSSLEINTPPSFSSADANITCVDLSENSISEFPDFHSLVRLELLDLQQNILNEIPPSIGRNRTLVEIHFNNNNIAKCAPQIALLQSLERLYLHDNMINEIPAEVGYLTRLEELVLNCNPLKQIPPTIGLCQALEVLDVGYCGMLALPEEITRLKGLVELHASNNEFNRLPKNMGKLTKLRLLNISSNKLETLPVSLHLCTDLEELNITANPFSDDVDLQVLSGAEGYVVLSLLKQRAEEKPIGRVMQSVAPPPSPAHFVRQRQEAEKQEILRKWAIGNLPHYIDKVIQFKKAIAASESNDQLIPLAKKISIVKKELNITNKFLQVPELPLANVDRSSIKSMAIYGVASVVALLDAMRQAVPGADVRLVVLFVHLLKKIRPELFE